MPSRATPEFTALPSSFYECVRTAAQAVDQGVHDDAGAAVAALFASARAPKRSKIASFVTLVETLDGHLQFPGGIPKKLGLSLVAALRADRGLRRHLTEALRKTAPDTPEAERGLLERSLRLAAPVPQDAGRNALKKPTRQAGTQVEGITPGITFSQRKQRLTLSGPGVTPEFAAELRRWLDARNTG